MHDVRLLTEWGSIALDGSRVGLEEWPAFLDGFNQDYAWDDHSGEFREMLPGGVQDGEMTLRVKSENVGADVSELLDSLRWGEDGFTVQVTSHGAEVRTLPCRLKDVGQINWFPEPRRAVYAEVPLRVEYRAGAWLGEHIEYALTGVRGQVTVPYAGDVPVWPSFMVMGHVAFRLRAEDEWLRLPDGAYSVFTDPANRGMVYHCNTRQDPFIVPFWPEAPRLVPGGFTLEVDVPADATLTVVFDELWRKAWA